MIHSIVLAGQLWLVLCECQDVCGSVYLGYDIHSILLSQLLELYKLLLGIGAVLGGQAGISVTLKAEARLSLAPVIAEELAETAVVEVHLQGVHLIVRHHLGQIAQVRDGDVLASAVDHETAHTVIGLVGDDALGQSLALCLLVDLQQCACSPHDTLGGGSCEGHIGSDVDAVTLLAESFVAFECKHDIAGFWRTAHDAESLAGHLFVVRCQSLCHSAQLVALHYQSA